MDYNVTAMMMMMMMVLAKSIDSVPLHGDLSLQMMMMMIVIVR